LQSLHLNALVILLCIVNLWGIQTVNVYREFHVWYPWILCMVYEINFHM